VETKPELQAPPDFQKVDRPVKPGRSYWGWLWLLLLGGLAFGGYRWYQASQQKKAAAEAAQAQRAANRAVSISASPARRADLPVILRGLGTVTAYNTVNVKARVDGPIVAIHFTEGQFVNQGQVLAELDPRTFQAALDQAEGQLARDQAQLHDAEVNQQRYQKLWEAQVIAKQQLDTQAAAVGQYRGGIEADQAAIENAKLNLSFTKITAPMSGRIGLRMVDVGNIVHASDANPLAVITQMQPIAVLFTLPADSLPSVLAKLRAGAKLPVEAYDRADQNRIATGTLQTVDNQIDPQTGTTRLKAVFQNSDSALFPQQFVNCRLLLETRRGALVIPSAAVQRGPRGQYVYVVKDDHTVTMRQVTLGITEGESVEVKSGVSPGEVVVTDGQDKLQEGGKVEVRGGAGSQAPQPARPAGKGSRP
jgi:multidrug efflux system membrane fusion protein